ncbi:hypothetical protein GGI43DRAFT_404531 [Trichoderma evansii]
MIYIQFTLYTAHLVDVAYLCYLPTGSFTSASGVGKPETAMHVIHVMSCGQLIFTACSTFFIYLAPCSCRFRQNLLLSVEISSVRRLIVLTTKSKNSAV